MVDEAGNAKRVTNPSEFPEGKVATIREPMVACTIIDPEREYIGAVLMEHRARLDVGQIRRSWITSPRIVWRCVTACPWQRLCSTSSIS